MDAWVESGITDGVGTVTLSSWLYFYDFVHERFADDRILDQPSYVFRGQRSSDWRLVSTLDRLLGDADEAERAAHLQRFQVAARGRRGPNPPLIEDENDWWALGQHFGLATPLLDWTTSPFVAAFFAFVQDGEGRADRTEHRAVFALHEPLVAARSRDIVGIKASARKRNPAYQFTSGIEFVRPQSDENPRLLNQGGLFTRCPDGDDIEAWVRRHFEGENDGYILMKILIPDRDRDLCLRDLNRMNINHLSLFPDLYGASQYCNLHRLIRNY